VFRLFELHRYPATETRHRLGAGPRPVVRSGKNPVDYRASGTHTTPYIHYTQTNLQAVDYLLLFAYALLFSLSVVMCFPITNKAKQNDNKST